MVLALPFSVFILAVVGLAIVMLSHPLGNAVSGWVRATLRVAAFALGPLATLTVSLARWISNRVGAAIMDATAAVVGWFGALTHVLEHVLGLAVSWPAELLRMQEWLLTHAIPRMIRALVHVTPRVIHAVTSRVVRVERTVVQFPRLARGQAKALIAATVSALIGPYLYPLKWLRAHFATLTHAIAVPFPWHWPRDRSAIWKRLRKLERFATPAALAAAVVATLARLGLNWLRCRNVARAGKAVCGLDTSFLDSLLLDAVAIFSVLSVVEFATELRAIEDEGLAIMGKLIREWP